MRVLMLKAYYEPEIAAGIYLASDLVEDMSKKGIYVDVYVPTPTRGISQELRNKYKKEKKKEIKNQGKVIIHRFPLWRESTGSIGRAVRYVVQNIIETWIGITKKYDVLLLGSTPPTNGVMGVIIKKIKRKRFVYVIDDLFPDSLVAARITHKDSMIYRIGSWMERITYRNADDIIVISKTMKQNLLEKNVPEKKIHVVYNWVDENAVKPVERKDNTLFDELKLDRERFYITYAGNLGHSQNIEVIVKAAERLKDYDIHFLIFGEGSQKEKIQNLIKKKQLKNVELLPLKEYSRVSEVYSLGNASIVSCYPGTGQSALPSKTWSIMAAGKPVVASFDPNSELEWILKKSGAGVFVEANNDKCLSEEILKLYKDSQRCKKMGEQARNFVQKNISRSVCTEKYCRILKK